MPTTGAAAKRKAAVRSPNGRLRKPSAPKGSSTTPAGPKKVASKNAVPEKPAGAHPGAQGKDKSKAVRCPPRRRRAKAGRGRAQPRPPRPRLHQRRRAPWPPGAASLWGATTTAAARRRQREQRRPKFNSKKLNFSGAVTRAGIHCGCCDTAMPLPAFSSHAGGGASPPAWERLLLMSGKPLLRCVQEAWGRSAQAKKKLLGRSPLLAANGNDRHSRKGAPALESVSGGGDRSDDACGVCTDGGQLLCCDSSPSTFHPECLGVQVPEGSWVCHYCRCFVCLASDAGHGGSLATCQQCARKCTPVFSRESSAAVQVVGILVASSRAETS